MKYLSEKILPINYNLYINLDIINDCFNGENIIMLNCVESTNLIEFHSLNLNINSISLNNIYIDINKLLYDTDNDIYSFNTQSNLIIGNHTLIIKFSCPTFSVGVGLVKNINKIKNNRTLYFTRFEPNFARKAFPCWDAPNFKVKYNMKIEINDLSYSVLFNTDTVKTEIINNSSIMYYFQETISMSTYVMSFIIGKFYYIESYTDNNIRLRVYIPADIPKSLKVGDFSLMYGIKIMNFISEYYQVPYALNKLDFIPIDNVDAKGMENYGLIFYDLPYILFNKATTTINIMIGIVTVIAHEIAHQWFGNLVTMSKWNELWLKESFAKFFEYFIIDKICPEWNIKSLYIKNLLRTFEFDSIALKSICIDKINNKQISQIYDDITYFKGSNLLFMLQDILGEKYFKERLRIYLDRYKFSVITVDNFINCLTELLTDTEKKYIESIIKTYTTNKGIPIIKMTESDICIIEFNTRKIINNIIKNKPIYNIKKNKWSIPLKINFYNYGKDLLNTYTILSSGETHYNINELNNLITPNILNNKISFKTKIEQSINDNKFISIINNKSHGYYKFCYNDKQFTEIINNITLISYDQLISIINDLYILGIYNLCPIHYFIIFIFKLIDFLITINDPYKHNYYLISIISKYINNIKSIFDKQYIYNIYPNKFIERSKNIYKIIFEKTFKKLIVHLINIFDIFNIDVYLSNNFFSNKLQYNKLLLFLLDYEILNPSANSIINHIIDNKLFNISGDLNKIIIKYIIKQNNIEKLLELKQFNEDLYEIIITSLKYTSNNKIIDKIFNNYFINKTINLSHDKIIELLTNNKYFVSICTQYFINNYDDYIKIIPLDSKSFIHILKNIILNQSDPNVIEQLFKKLKSIDSTYFLLILNQSKNLLFNKLFIDINLIKLLNNLIK
jgi:hypothetical protein